MQNIIIPKTYINGKTVSIGDKVTVFHSPSGRASYTNCEIIEVSGRRAILIEPGMWAFGIGNHEIMKEEKRCTK